MYSEAELTKARGASIIAYLMSQGHNPAPGKSNTANTYFKSPFTNEKTASFRVKHSTNVYTDYSGGGWGDVLNLIEKLERIPFDKAVEKALSLVGSQGGVIINPEPPDEVKIRSVAPLTNTNLLDYICNERGINIDVAKHYCRQINYTLKRAEGNTTFYYAIGFKSDLGAWNIRNKFFKGVIGDGVGPTLIPGTVTDKTVCNVVEGFIDFLTLVMLNKCYPPKYDTYILNSIVYKTMLPVYPTYNCYTNNDRGGQDVADYLATKGQIKDFRHFFAGSNDLNEHFVKQLK